MNPIINIKLILLNNNEWSWCISRNLEKGNSLSKSKKCEYKKNQCINQRNRLRVKHLSPPKTQQNQNQLEPKVDLF